MFVQVLWIVSLRAVPNIRFEFEPDRIVGQMDYSYSSEYCQDLEPEYG